MIGLTENPDDDREYIPAPLPPYRPVDPADLPAVKAALARIKQQRLSAWVEVSYFLDTKQRTITYSVFWLNHVRGQIVGKRAQQTVKAIKNLTGVTRIETYDGRLVIVAPRGTTPAKLTKLHQQVCRTMNEQWQNRLAYNFFFEGKFLGPRPAGKLDHTFVERPLAAACN